MAYTAIDNPELYMQVKLYTGDASATAHTLDGSENMQPDLAWFKSRSRADNHRIVDVLRTTYSIKSNTTGAEVDSGSDGFTSLDADGFTLNGSGGGGEFNAASGTYVTWCWKAGGSGSSNADGAISTTRSVSTTAGFSIMKYTGSGSGSNIAHGLGATPELTIRKNTGGVQDWNLHTTVIDGSHDYFILNTTAAKADSSLTAPSSTLVYTAADSATFIVYAFKSIQGFSKFGSYIGNGNADGVFVYTGFRPAFLLAKCSSTTAGGAGAWYIFDGKRAGYNFANYSLKTDSTDVEATSTYLELLSNGFKIYNAAADLNGSGNTHIYMAFAEAPFVNSNGVPCNAR